MKALYDPPKIVKLIFNKFIWNAPKNKILFTFDDGPNTETTPMILKKLSDLHIKAVFFCVGTNLLKFPSLVDEIVSEGHLIGNHTWNHKKVIDFQNNDFQNEIAKFNEYMLQKFNHKVELFRPPHGKINFKFYRNANAHQLKVMMWSLLTYDYKNDLKVVKFALQKYLIHNSIIVMHDSEKSKNVIYDSIEWANDMIIEKNLNIGNPASCLS
jgi:peptidoglycan/xylan/chitin deacetylase (PgdA/CDA1 family)